MRFDGMNTMEGRHLVFAYAAVLLLQGGYFVYVVRQWLGLGKPVDLENDSSSSPAK
jgi:hypothetical protein